MENGKRDYMKMGWDKREIDCDVGLGLKVHPYQRGLVRKIISDEPFTADQRQELERQTIIYKYMMASMPVPPQLLIPLSKHTANGGKGGGDPEPWRCRRTDGKKWRCSRDVTPDHKYCERHSHKGKPSARSRKPVESVVSPLPPPTNNAGGSNPIDFSSPLVQYNLLSSPSYRYPERSRPQNHTVGQRPDATSTTTATTGTTAFIDAWSLADAKTTSSSSPNHSTLPLTLSVSSINDHDSNIGMRSMTSSSSSSQPLNWMTSWISSPPGGPLAEALCLGIGAGTTSYDMRNNFEDLVSSYGRNSNTNSGNKDTSDQIFRLH